jgi:hypothetical protein
MQVNMDIPNPGSHSRLKDDSATQTKSGASALPQNGHLAKNQDINMQIEQAAISIDKKLHYSDAKYQATAH